MNIVIKGKLKGCVTPPPSKSQAHRLLICAALGRSAVRIFCDSLNDDLCATMESLNALGAGITYAEGAFDIVPVSLRKGGVMPCGESGSTLRFLLPVAAALGADATLTGKGKLPLRPMDTLFDALKEHGTELEELSSDAHLPLVCRGRLTPGEYSLPGEISSQYFTGLLFALPLLDAESKINVVGELTSASYVGMTLDALRLSGIKIDKSDGSFGVPAPQEYSLPSQLRVEGDWSSAAFWLVAGVIGDAPISICGMNAASLQGDRRIIDHLRKMGAEIEVTDDAIIASPSKLHGAEIDCTDTPDLVPILSVAAAAAEGETLFTHVGRLRYKESDRLEAMRTLLASFGICSVVGEDSFCVMGGRPVAMRPVDSFGDHRIAMSAAIMSTIADGATTIDGAECVAKSYPGFYDDFTTLGGMTTTIE